MADNQFKYQIDIAKIKNSKLFQKFVKEIEPGHAKQEPPKPVTQQPIDYHVSFQRKLQPPQVKQQNQLQTYATSESFVSKPTEVQVISHRPATQHYSPEKVTHFDTISHQGQNTVTQPNAVLDFQNSQSLVYVPAASERATATRQPRVREGRPRGQFAQHQQTFNSNQQPDLPAVPQPIIQQPRSKAPSVTGFPSPYNSVQPPPTISPVPTIPSQSHHHSMSPSLTDQKSRYQRLQQSFQQFKQASALENRQKKAELLEFQSKYDALREKVYEFQTTEDELKLEVGKLKQKIATETIGRTRLEEQNKELGYRVQELEDQLENREDALRKRNEEVNYLKAQTENLRAEVQSLRLTNQKLSISLREHQEQQEFLRRERQNKDSLQTDMKERVTSLIRQNAKLKDQLHFTNSRLNELEVENFTLRTDLNRQNNGNTFNTRQVNPVQARSQPEQPYRHNTTTSLHETSIAYDHSGSQVEHKAPRRRGQFNRERQRLNENTQQGIPNRQMQPPPAQYSNTRPNQVQRVQPNIKKNDEQSDLVAKKDALQKRLEKNRAQRAVTGAIRKQRIELEREIQSINNKLVELRGPQK